MKGSDPTGERLFFLLVQAVCHGCWESLLANGFWLSETLTQATPFLRKLEFGD